MLEKITQEQIDSVIKAVFSVYKDTKDFEGALELIKSDSERIERDKQIAQLREQQRQYNEQIESQIQSLLGM